MQNWHLDLTNLLEKKKTTVVKKVPKDTTSKKTESKFKAIRREISEDFPVLPNRTEKETESFNETFDFKWEGEINLPYYDDSWFQMICIININSFPVKIRSGSYFLMYTFAYLVNVTDPNFL